jgi:hypothetical protein
MSDEYEFDQARLDALNLEANLFPNETSEVTARRLMRENLVAVTQRIVGIALNSTSDRTALDASKYVMERVLGKVGDDAALASDNKLSMFVNELEEELKRTK